MSSSGAEVGGLGSCLGGGEVDMVTAGGWVGWVGWVLEMVAPCRAERGCYHGFLGDESAARHVCTWLMAVVSVSFGQIRSPDRVSARSRRQPGPASGPGNTPASHSRGQGCVGDTRDITRWQTHRDTEESSLREEGAHVDYGSAPVSMPSSAARPVCFLARDKGDTSQGHLRLRGALGIRAELRPMVIPTRPL